DLGEVVDGLLGDVGHHDRPGAGALDEPVLFEPAQRLAHRGGADRQLLGEAALGHLLTGAERAGADRLPQSLVREIGPGLRRGLDHHAATITLLWQTQMPSLDIFAMANTVTPASPPKEDSHGQRDTSRQPSSRHRADHLL